MTTSSLSAVDDLPTSLFAALGRMTWAAMGVEDRASSLATDVLALERADRSVGILVQSAIDRLERAERPDDYGDTIVWLRRAQAGLVRRNEVLHSQYVEWWAMTNGKPERTGKSYLLHLPNRVTRPAVYTLVDEASFDRLTDELNGIVADWTEAAMSFHRAGGRP